MKAGGYAFQPLVWILRFEGSVLMMLFLVNSSMMDILSLLWIILEPSVPTYGAVDCRRR
jgi:hypothetical protein